MRLFSRRELIIFTAVFIPVLVIAVIIAVISSGPSEPVRPPVVVSDGDANRLSFDDFLVPDEYRLPWYLDWKYFREPREQWDQETKERFLEDTRGIVLDIIEDENTERLISGR